MYSGEGVKKYGSVNWIIFLDKEHIIHNEIIKDRLTKIDPNFMDEYWNKFAVKYNANLDMYNKLDNGKFVAVDLEDYKPGLAKSQLTLSDFDELLADLDASNNKYTSLEKKVKKLEEKLRILVDEMKNLF